MDPRTLLLVAAKTATLALGALVTGLAYRAYRRAGGPALRALAGGFALVTLGASVGGVLHVVFDVGLLTAATVQATCTAAGFGVLVHSLYVESAVGVERSRDRDRDRDRKGGRRDEARTPPGDD